MRKTLAVLLLSVAVASATEHARARDVDLRSIVPGNWQLLPPDANWHSYRFVSPTGEAWLALYAKPADDHSISAHMRWVRSVKGERITYERHGQSWIVVSGVKGDRIFYRKAMLACGNRRWHHLAFEYPAAEKRAFDQFVTQASRALRIYQRMGCGDENR